MAGHPMFSRQIVYRPKWVLRREIALLDALSDLRGASMMRRSWTLVRPGNQGPRDGVHDPQH